MKFCQQSMQSSNSSLLEAAVFLPCFEELCSFSLMQEMFLALLVGLGL